MGFSTNANYGRRIGEWQVTGYVTYVQNVQTLLVTYDTSAYSFSGKREPEAGTNFYWSARVRVGPHRPDRPARNQ